MGVKVIAATNLKGGVGKSTTAVHLAAGLATLGYKVGLGDTDVQGHCAVMLAMEEEEGLYNYLIEGRPIQDVVRLVPTEHYSTPDNPSKGELYLLPSSEMTYEIATRLDEHRGFAFVELTEDFAQVYQLDFIIVDTNPTRSRLDGAISLAVDHFIYVTDCERLSFDGLVKALDKLQGFMTNRQKYLRRESSVIGIIPNKMRANTNLHRDNLAALVERYGALVWPPIILRTGWGSATNLQELVYTHVPSGQESADAWALVKRTLEAVGLWQNSVV